MNSTNIKLVIQDQIIKISIDISNAMFRKCMWYSKKQNTVYKTKLILYLWAYPHFLSQWGIVTNNTTL